ncbi:hypothetical protein ACSNOI_14715 [Actinomadura kijaniata]|uniref:hypothetical protein n=1 Tax=Actinomadura kijaniata TaxID=46161 RepID=UPI003F1CD1BE
MWLFSFLVFIASHPLQSWLPTLLTDYGSGVGRAAAAFCSPPRFAHHRAPRLSNPADATAFFAYQRPQDHYTDWSIVRPFDAASRTPST